MSDESQGDASRHGSSSDSPPPAASLSPPELAVGSQPSDERTTAGDEKSLWKQWWFILAIVVASIVCVAIVVSRVNSFFDDDETGAAGDDPTQADVDTGDGARFTDPDGLYELMIDAQWEEQSSTAGERWLVGPARTGANLVIGTYENTAEFDEDLLDEVAEGSLRGFEVSSLEDGEVIDQSFVVGHDGQRLGRIELRAVSDDVPVRTLVIAAGAGGNLATAVLSSLEDDFDEVRAEVEPYLLTLAVRQ